MIVFVVKYLFTIVFWTLNPDWIMLSDSVRQELVLERFMEYYCVLEPFICELLVASYLFRNMVTIWISNKPYIQ